MGIGGGSMHRKLADVLLGDTSVSSPVDVCCGACACSVVLGKYRRRWAWLHGAACEAALEHHTGWI